MVQLTLWFHAAVIACYALGLLLAAGRRLFSRLPAWTVPAAAGAGLLLQAVLMGLRWGESAHFPVTGLFETLHFLAFWVAGITIYFLLRYRAECFVPAGLALALAALAGASGGRFEVFPLTPALDTPLFLIHVATAFAAYGLWGVAGLVGGFMQAGGEDALDGAGRRMMDESIYLGYALFTVCMLVGCLWAYLAWGSYWTWNIKGLWSFLLWFYYSGVMHVRNRPSWQGWPVSALAILGFLLTLFTFLGLGLVFKSNHPLT